MKVVDHLDKATRPLISFEIIPPLRGGNLATLLSLIEDLKAFDPPYIDITSHAAEALYEETRDGVVRRIKRKRPGTLGLCALIQNKFDIDAVPHVLCHGFSREETEDVLIEFKYLGIENVLAVRGDEPGYKKKLDPSRSANVYAADLVRQIVDMNRGRYLEEDLLNAEKTDFCIGVGGYPEKHFEAPNLSHDIRFTKEKVEAGAEYIVTQMFFDNDSYFGYVDACRAAGVNVPIIPGLKILTSRNHLQTLPANFYVNLPNALVDQVANAETATDVRRIGVQWALEQAEDLINRGVPSVHFYVMQSSVAIKSLLSKLEV